jgi:hypothetical protein
VAALSSLALALVDVSRSLAGDHVLARPGLDSATAGLGSIFYADSCLFIHCLFSALRSRHSGPGRIFYFHFSAAVFFFRLEAFFCVDLYSCLFVL